MAYLIFFFKKMSQKFIGALLRFRLEEMLSANFFSLIVLVLDIGGLYTTLIGIILSVLAIFSSK